MKLLEGLPEIKSMSAEQESALAKENTDSARTKIVLANMREAFLYCKTCCRNSVEDDEIFSLCYEALQKTALRFDPRKGRFFAYSKVEIRGQISRMWKSRDVVKHSSLHEIKVKIDPKRSPDVYERGEIVEMDENTDSWLRDAFVEPEFDAIHTDERWELVKSSLVRLSERERMVVELSYRSGFAGQKIGDMLGVSRQAVKGILNRAIRKIRRELRKKKLHA